MYWTLESLLKRRLNVTYRISKESTNIGYDKYGLQPAKHIPLRPLAIHYIYIYMDRHMLPWTPVHILAKNEQKQKRSHRWGGFVTVDLRLLGIISSTRMMLYLRKDTTSQVKMTDMEHAVETMDIPLFPSTIMNTVFGHYFGTAENIGLNSKPVLISSKE